MTDVNEPAPVVRVSLADQVYDRLHAQVLSLELAPGTKISEAEISKQLGVSRQVVRDAFYRLSLLGFLVIRPQKATVVSHISARDIFEARYLRTAIEIETARQACDVLSVEDFEALCRLIDQQRTALRAEDQAGFHRLDNLFHKEICERAGFGFAWDAIQEQKAHTDRVRYASLSFGSQRALDGHVAIVEAFKAKDVAHATEAVRVHLSDISRIVDKLRQDNHDWFED